MDLTKLAISLVRGYQKYISPLFPPSCRYQPTCSQYTIQAIEKHGTLKGAVMGLARIIRCNPFVQGGYDEVPDYFTLRRNPDSQAQYEADQSLTREDLIDLLLADYQKDLVYNDQPLEEFLDQRLNYRKLDLGLLDEDYLDGMRAYTEDLGLSQANFSLVQVQKVKDQETPPKGDPTSLVNQALGGGSASYLLLEDQVGILDGSPDYFALDLVLAFGVREVDVQDKSSRLLHYLRVLDQVQV